MTPRHADGVLLVGTFPPPIDGMSVVNVALAEALKGRGAPAILVDTSAKGLAGMAYHGRRLAAHLSALFAVLGPRGVGAGTLCHGVNAGLAMPYTLALVAGARLVGMRIVLYYHSSKYLRRRSRLLAAIVRIAGQDGLHVLASEEMVQRFRRLYAKARRFQVVDNCAYVAAASSARVAVRDPIRMGLLSNLSMEKGLGLAIETACELRRRGVEARLILAGPLVDAEARSAAERARRDLGGAVKFLGTVQDEAKARFFADIDLFLFPSLYPHETQSIVVPEAMAAGLPVLVHDHAFIRNLLADPALDHLLLPADGSFPRRAADAIVRWRDDSIGYAADARRCRHRFDHLREQGREQLDRLVSELAPTLSERSATPSKARMLHGHR